MRPDLRFQFVPYPLWRRRWPAPIARAARWVALNALPGHLDVHPPTHPMELAQYFHRWGIVPDVPLQQIATWIEAAQGDIVSVNMAQAPAAYAGAPVRLPAQWEAQARVILTWPILYPPLWAMHTAMLAAMRDVVAVDVVVPSQLWAQAVVAYLAWRGANTANVRVLVLPTDDMWVRDYGPVVGYAPDGQRVVVGMRYDYLPDYPQGRDDAMRSHYAAHLGLPLRPLPLHLEGGNIWSDGAGTLLMAEQVLLHNPYHSRASLEAVLHDHIAYEKLLLTPSIPFEETGHVDLVVKLASAEVVLVSAATSFTAASALRAAKRVFARHSNAAGTPYTVLELPTPPLYVNWLTYPVRRHYTNALTVNGKVLVPVFNIAEDERALRVYEQAMPQHQVVPIDCAAGINGGGAVHCLTKEIPA